MVIADGLSSVRARIAAACGRVGRDPSEVRLVAVSKRHDASKIREAYALGQRDFGENYAQELRDKAAALADLVDLRWHAIGPLQTNKAKFVAQSASAFHALDRLAVAVELGKRRASPLACFLEVNVGGEATKGGVAPEALPGLLAAVREVEHIDVVGLMTLPPPEDPEDARPYFRQLRELAREHGLVRLSMGTTDDFEVAVEEGATDVRVGRAVFGERPAG